MNIFFWRNPKVKPPTPRIFEIPEEMRLEFLRLCDELEDDKKNQNVRAYKMWKCVHGLFPETKEGQWKLSVSQPAIPRIIEKL